jgi:maltooligosyltrehalose trehalohydrolase
VTAFRVWAPAAGQIELEVEGRRYGMQVETDGWRFAEVSEAGAGGSYRYVVDGDPLPDPRSASQPQGVHGPSQLVDHSSFAWGDQDWRGIDLRAAIIYELHVGTFTREGTFDAVVAKLDHFLELGVNAIELMPVAEFSGDRGWGYDGVDLFAPHHAYGGPEGLKRLVDACHQRGLAVIMDVVYNHLGPTGNYLGRYGPYFTDRYATPWGQAVNYDGADSKPVRDFVCDNALMWLRDYHCDGLRLDAVHAIFDMSALHILEELGLRVEAMAGELGRSVFVIAESDVNDPRLVRAREAGGYGMDAQWSDDFHHALHAVLTGERSGYYADFGAVADIAYALKHAYVYDGRFSRYRRRVHGRPASGLPGSRFLGYLQNHDQVGNRARGERSSALMSTGKLKVGAGLVLTSPFIPMLFQGEEWGAATPFCYFTDHREPELARAVSQGRIREFEDFGWRREDIPDPQRRETFEASRLDWAELEREPHASLLRWHRELIALRKRLPALGDGSLEAVRTCFSDEGRWLVVERGPVTIAANLGEAPACLTMASGRPRQVLLASEPSVRDEGGVLELPTETIAILGPAGGS